MTYLATHEAQRRVVATEYLALSVEKQRYWDTILLACQSPGIPVTDPWMQAQLAAIWKVTSQTYGRLMA